MNQKQQPLAELEETSQAEEPEFFDRALLQQPPSARLEYFEQHCLIEHPRLLDALDAILEAICAPGEGKHAKRPGTTVLVIGPARVGKTTLIHLLEERLLAYATSRMQADPHFIPFASITAPEPGSGRFDWTDFYKPVLRQLGNPFVDSPGRPIRVGQMREATEAAYLERNPLAIIVDEAHHLAAAARGSRLQSQLNHLKNFENTTGVSHILVGTYEMRPFRKINPQLALRSIDVHFPRYDMTDEKDCLVFQSILWALQRQLPVEEEPLLAEKHWEFLYARSIGCIGLLKLHLNRALKEGSRTITLDHLRQTAMSDVRVKLALRNALESEAEFVEAEDADEQLLALLRKPLPRSPQPSEQKQDVQEKSPPSHPPKKRLPGKRAPGRDATGSQAAEEILQEQKDEERAAG